MVENTHFGIVEGVRATWILVLCPRALKWQYAFARDQFARDQLEYGSMKRHEAHLHVMCVHTFGQGVPPVD